MKSIKKKQLEIKLQRIPPHPNPKPEYEQYQTPANIASDILYNALTKGDIYDKTIADLGCGTGIFSIGSALLGAKKVYGVDIDSESIQIAKDKSKEFNFDDRIDWIIKNVEDIGIKCDTVIMNPPFGSQNKGADIPFLNKAFDIAHNIYSLHNAKTRDYLRKYIKDNGYQISWEKRYMFEIDRIFKFHTKDVEKFQIILFALCEDNI